MGMAKHIVLAQIHQVKSADVNSASSNQSNEGGEIPRLPKLARPVAETAIGLFLVFQGLGAYPRVAAKRAPCRSMGEKMRITLMMKSGAAMAAAANSLSMIATAPANRHSGMCRPESN
jgi:hypothetical protein